jgi:hypothetical protein
MSELDEVPRPPRRLPRGTIGKLLKASIFPLLFGGIWFAVGAGLAAIFFTLGNPLHDERLSRECERTEGTVAEVTLNQTARINSRNPWNVRYTFEVDGRTWGGESYTTDEDVVRGLEEGSRIEVEYLPGMPEMNRARGTRASLFPAVIFIVPGFFTVVGGMILAGGIGKVLRLRSLLVNGQAALARATTASLSQPLCMGRRRPMTVRYSFQDIRGTEWPGRTRVYFPKQGLEVRVGEELKIVYDYGNPRRSLAYEVHGIDLSGQG